MIFSNHKYLLALACCASIAGCDIPNKAENTAANSVKGETELVSSLKDIKGFWLIERFEEFEPSWENGAPWRNAFVQIDDDYLTYKVGCNQSGNPVLLGSDGILRDTGDGSRMQTLEGCEPSSAARDGRFFGFFSDNPQVRRLEPDRVFLKSDTQELVLVSPVRWYQTHKPKFLEIKGRWIPQMSTTYDGWESSGFGIGENQGIVTIGRSHMVWSQCSDLPISIRWTREARLAAKDAIDLDDCRAVKRATTNGPRAIMTMLTANPMVIRTGPDSIVLVDGIGEKGRRIDLQSEESVLNPHKPPPIPKEYPTPPLPPSFSFKIND